MKRILSRQNKTFTFLSKSIATADHDEKNNRNIGEKDNAEEINRIINPL